MKDEILFKVKKALSETLNLKSAEHIQLETKLKDELGLDSMTSLNFLMELENNIGNFIVDPDTLEADDLSTVESIISYVTKEISTKSNAAIIQEQAG